MASTYVNDLRLSEMATGDASGSWGTVTNTNLELIGEALGFGTEAITTNADAHTSTIADGSTDPIRAIFIKYTGTLDSACTITIGPNTVNKFCFIHNATSGSQSIIISQGSGANITIATGQTKGVYLDGAGSGAAVIDAFATLSVVDLLVDDDLTVTDDVAIGGLATVGGTLGVTGIATFTDDIIIGDGKTIGSASDVDAITIAANGQVTLTQTLIGTALDISGDIDVDGTTNLDAVDIDGAVDMASTLTVNDSVTFVSSGSSKPQLTIKNTNADANPPGLIFQKDSASPADADEIANINFYGDDSGGNVAAYAGLKVISDDVTDGTEDGSFHFRTMVAGTIADRVVLGTTLASSVDIIRGGTVITDGSITDTGDFTIDVAGDIILDAGGQQIILKDDGTTFAEVYQSSNSLFIESKVSDKDIFFRGNDGGSDITALTLDMSAAGLAIFNAGIALGGSGAANTLDDYEEGTWTPDQGGGLTVGGTFSSNGRYTKVGNLVTVCGNVNGASSIAVSAIGVICTNLPFSIAEIATLGIVAGAWTSSTSATFIGLGATTTLYSVQAVSGATNLSFTHTYRV